MSASAHEPHASDEMSKSGSPSVGRVNTRTVLMAGRRFVKTQTSRGRAVLIGAADAGVATAVDVRPVCFVNGFWRSGTTWVQEVLADITNSKTVVEPFSSDNRWYRARLQRLRPDEEASFYAAFAPGPSVWDELAPQMNRAMRGISASGFSLMLRRSLVESTRRTVVVKDVHSHFVLPQIHDAYGVPIVHMSRHPGAVVASFERTSWGWDWSRVSLEGLLGAVGLGDQLSPYVDSLRWADRQGSDAVTIATYWAICEEIALDSISLEPWAYHVEYESLVQDPSAGFTAMIDSIGLDARGDGDYGRPSATTSGGRQELSTQARVSDWESKLAPGEVSAIEEAVRRASPRLADRYF